MTVVIGIKGTELALGEIDSKGVAQFALTDAQEVQLIVGLNMRALGFLMSSGPFRDTYRRAALVLADGFPVWLACRLRSWSWDGHRIGSTDWIARLEGGRSRRIAVIGGSATTSQAVSRRLAELLPATTIRTWDGFVDLVRLEETGLVELHSYEPDLVLLGLGMPRQEQWLAQHQDCLPRATYALVGGALDQLAGTQIHAPRWLGKIGFEWLFRLLTQPRRLWRRYLVETPRVAANILYGFLKGDVYLQRRGL